VTYLLLAILAAAIVFVFLVWCPCALSSRRSEEERRKGRVEE